MKINCVRGCINYTDKEQVIRNFVKDTLRKIFNNYGYASIETPILSYFEVLAGKYEEGNDILKEIYRLEDQGKRQLGLRYDLTVPFATYIALNKNTLNFPFKRYEIDKVFRDGPIKVGRDREFTQCDVDVVGIKGELIEGELLNLYVEAFKKLGIEINIQYNNRKLMVGLIEEKGINKEDVNKVITIIDKMDKLKYEDFLLELNKLNLKEDKLNSLLEDFKMTLEELSNKYQNTNNEILREGLDELNKLSNLINKLEIDEYCTFTPTLARGQNYYTGTVFEVYEKNKKISCAIGGGGRYDNMIADFIGDGLEYPAVGISFGLSSIYELLKTDERFINKSLVDLFIIPMNTENESLMLANKLRGQGIKTEIEYRNRKMKKSMEYANRENIPYVIVLGEDELNNKTIKLKNMITGENKEISLNNIEEIKDVIEKGE